MNKKLEEDSKVLKKLRSMHKNQRYKGGSRSKTLYMLVSSICPSASPEASSKIAPAIICAFFVDASLDNEIDVDTVIKNTPSPTTVRNIIKTF